MDSKYLDSVIEARDALDEVVGALQRVNEYAPQPVEADAHGVDRFRKNPIVVHLLDSHPTEDMNTLSVKFHTDSAARSQFAQLIGYSVSGASSLSYMNEAQIDGADQTCELRRENERLKAELAQLKGDAK